MGRVRWSVYMEKVIVKEGRGGLDEVFRPGYTEKVWVRARGSW